MNVDPKVKLYTDEQKLCGASINYDPEAMLEAEFAKDEKHEREINEKLYGKDYVARGNFKSQLA